MKYKYLTRLNIIATFNKLRINLSSENLTIFITTLRTYKYRVLLFELTNKSSTFQQYINNTLFNFINIFY